MNSEYDGITPVQKCEWCFKYKKLSSYNSLYYTKKPICDGCIDILLKEFEKHLFREQNERYFIAFIEQMFRDRKIDDILK